MIWGRAVCRIKECNSKTNYKLKYYNIKQILNLKPQYMSRLILPGIVIPLTIVTDIL